MDLLFLNNKFIEDHATKNRPLKAIFCGPAIQRKTPEKIQVGALVQPPKRLDMRAPIKRALCRNLLKKAGPRQELPIPKEALLFLFLKAQDYNHYASRKERGQEKASQFLITNIPACRRAGNF